MLLSRWQEPRPNCTMCKQNTTQTKLMLYFIQTTFLSLQHTVYIYFFQRVYCNSGNVQESSVKYTYFFAVVWYLQIFTLVKFCKHQVVAKWWLFWCKWTCQLQIKSLSQNFLWYLLAIQIYKSKMPKYNNSLFFFAENYSYSEFFRTKAAVDGSRCFHEKWFLPIYCHLLWCII